jgi:hypothetical protein
MRAATPSSGSRISTVSIPSQIRGASSGIEMRRTPWVYVAATERLSAGWARERDVSKATEADPSTNAILDRKSKDLLITNLRPLRGGV